MLSHIHGQQGTEYGCEYDRPDKGAGKRQVLFPVQTTGDSIINMEIVIGCNEQQIAKFDRERPAQGYSMVLQDRYPEKV